MDPETRMLERLRALDAAGLRRQFGGTPGSGLDARSNDYLGLAQLVSRETVAGGAGGSRLVTGTSAQHSALERELADWLGASDALVFSSAYAANTGVVSALATHGDTVFSDALNHASIIDGCRLARADTVVVPHLDLEALRRGLADRAGGAGQLWVVTESYFGMDGDSPDLRALRGLCDEHAAGLIVDEAHALGVFAAEGRGLCAAAGVQPDVLVGGMGKAFGAQGGFVAAARPYVDWLWNTARPFVFSTGVSPALCELVRGRLTRVREADGLRLRLTELERRLAGALQRAAIPIDPRRHGPIFPLVFGTEVAALRASDRLRATGILGQAIRPPTVPAGQSRLRIILRANMTDTDVDRIAAALIEAWAERDMTANGDSQPSPVSPRTAAPPPSNVTASAPEGMDLDAPGTGVARNSSSTPGNATGEARSRAVRRQTTSHVEDRALGPGTGASGGPSAPGADGPDPRPALLPVEKPCGPLAPSELDRTAAPALRPGDAAHIPSEHDAAQPAASAVASDQRSGGGTEGRRARSPSSAPPDAGLPGTAGEAASDVDAPLPLQHHQMRPRIQAVADGAPPTVTGSTDAGCARTLQGRAEVWVVLGTGTAVGKTYVSCALARLHADAGRAVLGLKPVETGCEPDGDPPRGSDAELLAGASFHVKHPERHPLYRFREPIAPSLAARRENRSIDIEDVRAWVEAAARDSGAQTLIVETAGGLFSPLGPRCTNFDLARALEPARWILVAPDRLGVLHDVSSALRATAALGREPDWLVLSAPPQPDTSTGTNRTELAEMGVAHPILELPRGGTRALCPLLGPARPLRQI